MNDGSAKPSGARRAGCVGETSTYSMGFEGGRWGMEMRIGGVTRVTGGAPHSAEPLLDAHFLADGRSSEDATLPVRRPAGGGSGWRVGGLAKSAEVARDALWVGDHREEAHAAFASRAGENLKPERPSQELGPRAIGPLARYVLDVLDAPRGCGRRALRGETRGARWTQRWRWMAPKTSRRTAAFGSST